MPGFAQDARMHCSCALATDVCLKPSYLRSPGLTQGLLQFILYHIGALGLLLHHCHLFSSATLPPSPIIPYLPPSPFLILVIPSALFRCFLLLFLFLPSFSSSSFLLLLSTSPSSLFSFLLLLILHFLSSLLLFSSSSSYSSSYSSSFFLSYF